MTRKLAEARALGSAKAPKFDGTAFLTKKLQAFPRKLDRQGCNMEQNENE